MKMAACVQGNSQCREPHYCGNRRKEPKRAVVLPEVQDELEDPETVGDHSRNLLVESVGRQR